MALGFAQDNNLRESQDSNSAAGILNNLGGTGIADDIKLFAGNLGTVHELDYGADNYTASKDAFPSKSETFYTTGDASLFVYIIIPITTFGRQPYSNDTILYTLSNNNEQQYHIVKNSNGIDRFQLFPYNVGTGVVGGSPRNWGFFDDLETKKFFRTEPVSFSNLENFSKVRERLNDGTGGVENPYSRRFTDSDSSLDSFDEIPPADRNKSYELTFLKFFNAAEFTSEIETAADNMVYKKSRNMVSFTQNDFTRTIELGGPSHIVNDSNTPLTDEENVPGLYIFGGGIATRAFSDKTNPWVEDGSHTMSYTTPSSGSITRKVIKTADSTQSARVLNLIWDQNPVLIARGTGNNQSVRTMTSIPVGTNWTHKAKVEINGEDYFLLLTDDPTTVGIT